jgi:hypothetical protein
MGTNYYTHIIPSHERKKELYDAIEANDFPLINKLTEEMYGDLRKDCDNKETIGGVVHLGKRSRGWKFLWNPNVFVIRHGHSEMSNGTYKWIEEPSTPIYTYPLTKQGLHDFIFREDVLIYDEYNELQDKEEFWQMALSWGYDNDNEGWDAAGYEKEYHKHIYPVTGELTDLLKAEGYQFTSMSNSDFYSDGLRFAGYTDFS